MLGDVWAKLVPACMQTAPEGLMVLIAASRAPAGAAPDSPAALEPASATSLGGCKKLIEVNIERINFKKIQQTPSFLNLSAETSV